MYELIQHQEVGSGGASAIEFTNIPQIFDNLKIVISGRSDYTSADDFWKIEFNDYSTLPTGRLLYATGSNASLTTKSDGWIAPMPDSDSWTSNTYASGEIYVSNYTSSAAKAVSSKGIAENNATASLQSVNASIWNVANPITSIKLSSGNSATLLQYTTATLYGVGRKAGIGRQPLASGGYTSFVDGYWVHTFTANGSFKPFVDLDVEYLVVAGGGAGGYDRGSGGGAGGYRSSIAGEMSGGGASAESALSVTGGTNYSVVIGAGGAAHTSYSSPNSGSDSTFSTVTSLGGGGGRFGTSTSGTSGGSGSGCATSPGGPNPGGAGTTGQGFAGGNSGASGGGAGGGGGAGEVGKPGQDASGQAGAGGNGVASNVTGSLIYRAGGGGGGAAMDFSAPRGGGAGGIGGGAAGGNTNGADGGAGTVNTGGGGGGGANIPQGDGGAGGSGIVIVRYRA